MIFTNTISHAQMLQDKCFSELQKGHVDATITLPRIPVVVPIFLSTSGGLSVNKKCYSTAIVYVTRHKQSNPWNRLCDKTKFK